MTHKRMTIDLGPRSYDIHIGFDLLDNLSAVLPFALGGRSVFILSDTNVAPLYADQVRDSLKKSGAGRVEILKVPAGERSKDFATLEKVVGWMLDHEVTRESVLFTLGGGVVGDLGGFAASMVMRGIPFVQLPTSLLAMVDSAVGGKTAIDMPQGKNLVGAFYQPVAVIADLKTLNTLPDREMRAGYAETVKYGLINDESFFLWLEAHGKAVLARDPAALLRAVEVACAKKAEIVKADERETGQRALLNLGHTFAHVLESAAGYDGRLLHGEAVAIGIILAFTLSYWTGRCEDEALERVRGHFESVELPTRISDLRKALPVGAPELIASMKHDKKATSRGLTFVLTHGIGQACLATDVDMADVRAVLERSLSDN